MANNSGYKVINGTSPAINTVNAAKTEISVGNLRSKTSVLGFERLGWGDNCDKLFHDGLDVSFARCNTMSFADPIAMER